MKSGNDHIDSDLPDFELALGQLIGQYANTPTSDLDLGLAWEARCIEETEPEGRPSWSNVRRRSV